MEVSGIGTTQGRLTEDEIAQTINQAADTLNAKGKKVLAIIPDYTRTCPLPKVMRNWHKALHGVASRFDFMIALGTHPAMTEEQIDKLLGVEPGRREEVFPGTNVYNHAWNDPNALKQVGVLTSDRINEISGGLFAMEVPVTINKRVLEYDIVLIVGPVFPHEVVGFSGGTKYLFPGVCGPDMTNFFHWLGAVITNPRIIGTKNTPVRAVIEAAAEMLPLPKFALTMVVKGEDLAGLYFGEVRQSWSKAADLSDKLHIVYVDKPFDSILSQAPPMYDELWTGGKCMYKMESVVADGGELIIYAPHLNVISITHGKVIEQIGYHTRDYFLKQWDKFKHFPWGVIAHSTHVRGIGEFIDGVEKPRVKVTLATGISKEICGRINMGYRDPASIDVSYWKDKEDLGRLYVPKAGEMLYKLKNPPAWQTFEVA